MKDQPSESAPVATETGDEAAGRAPISVKRFLGETVVFGFVDTFDRAIGFALLIVTTRLMSPSQYGLLGLYATMTEIMQYVVAMGIFSSFFRYYTESVDPHEKRQIVNASFWIVTAAAFTLSLIAIPFSLIWGDTFFDTSTPFFALMTLPTCYLAVLISLGDSRLQADGRAFDFLKINVLQTITMRGLSLLLLLWGMQAKGWVIGQTAGQILTVICFAFMAFDGIAWPPDRKWFHKLFTYGVVLVPMAISHWSMQGCSKLMMRSFLDNPFHEIGVYGAGERISQLMGMLNLAFALGWRRFAFSNMHHEDGARLLGHGATVFLAISAYAAFGLVALGDDLIRWMIPKEYWPGIQVMPYLVLALFCWGISEVFNIGLHKSKRTRLMSGIYSSAAILSIPLNLILIPTLGIVGAAVSLLLAEFTKVAALWYFSQREFRLHVQYRRLALVPAVLVPLAILNAILFPDTTVASTLGQMGLVALAPVILVLVGFVRPEEKAVLRPFIRQALARLRG